MVQLEFNFGGEAAKSDGIHAVLRAANNYDPDWLDKATAVAVAYLSPRVGEFISGEKICDVVRSEIGEPHHPNVWGAFIHRLARSDDRVIRHTGMYTKSSRAAAHRAAVSMWVIVNSSKAA